MYSDTVHRRFWFACAAIWIVCVLKLFVAFRIVWHGLRYLEHVNMTAGVWFALMGFLFITAAFFDEWKRGEIQRLFGKTQ